MPNHAANLSPITRNADNLGSITLQGKPSVCHPVNNTFAVFSIELANVSKISFDVGQFKTT